MCCDDNIQNLGQPGADGSDGVSAYVYIAYADNVVAGTPDVVTTFNLNTPLTSSEWLAIITSSTPLSPVQTDFQGHWIQFKGATTTEITVKENDSVVTTDTNILNFQGVGLAGVDVVDDGGGQASINITTAAFIDVTLAELNVLMVTNGLYPGATYNITDYSLGELVLKATGTDSVSLDGILKCKVPDYQNASGLFGGVWYANMTAPTIGLYYAHDGYHWESLTGVVGTDPTLDAVNWVLIPLTDSSYVTEYHTVLYDKKRDFLFSRADHRGNIIKISYDNSFTFAGDTASFQWGNDFCFGNVAIEAVIKNVNLPFTYYANNLVVNGSLLDIGVTNTSTIVYGNKINNSTINDFYANNFNDNVLDKCTLSVWGAAGSTHWISSFVQNRISNGFASNVTLTTGGSGSITVSANVFQSIVLDTVSFTDTIGGGIGFSNCAGNFVSFTNTTFQTTSSSAGFQNCNFINDAQFLNCTINGNFTDCVFDAGVLLTSCTITTSRQTRCFHGRAVTGETWSTDLADKRSDAFSSNFECTIDLTDATKFATNTLTIPTQYSYCGIINLNNGTAEIITKIVNLPTFRAVDLKSTNTFQFTIRPTAVGGAANTIVSDLAPDVVIVGRASGSDIYTLRLDNSYNVKVKSVKII